jgi:hypothetical protein
MKLLLLLSAGIVLGLGLAGSGAGAGPKASCNNGTVSGSVGSITVTGTCAVVGPLTVNGNLTLGDGSAFVGFGPPIHVTGNVQVGKGAQFALGYNRDPGVLGPDVVDGNVVANQPLALYIGNSTVHGNVVSNGGGSASRFYNFPIKDNVIDGNLIIHGWTGGWWGAIANTVGGNLDASNNRSVVQPAGDCEGTFPAGCDAAPGADPDAGEIQSRGPDNPQHVSGNLICHGNNPATQINPDDGGFPNVVDGNEIGQCAGL